jgi:hypothetical protein
VLEEGHVLCGDRGDGRLGGEALTDVLGDRRGLDGLDVGGVLGVLTQQRDVGGVEPQLGVRGP